MSTKWIYEFGEGSADQKALLGGKGAYLSEMTRIGLRVPPGFTITTAACIQFWAGAGSNGGVAKWPEGLEAQMWSMLSALETKTGKVFGNPQNPLLVSVRSGAKVSMPGMMDTCLNIGLNDVVLEGLVELTKNPRFVWDSYRRLIQMFGDIVMLVPHAKFEEIIDEIKTARGVKHDTELNVEDLKELVAKFRQLIRSVTGKDFPQDPRQQIHMAIDAVFNSWNNARAIAYRNINGLPHDMGTAVNVQVMVFGNMNGDKSATGVAFTRNPSTGERAYYGEYLVNAQGEDVVAGIRTPMNLLMMKDEMPQIYEELCSIFDKLEAHFKEMQDVEFTIENGILYMLQCRTGKRTATAAVRVAVDMVQEGLISKEEALLRVTPSDIDRLLHKQIDPEAKKKSKSVAKGLPASPGAAVGQVVFSAADTVALRDSKRKAILVRLETSAEDIIGMHAAEGILTARGGMTSHAAVVCRGMNKCCVAGCSGIEVHEELKTLTIGGHVVHEGDILTLDGSTGEVFLGSLPLIAPRMEGPFETIMNWTSEFVTMEVHANANTPEDARVAREFGATGCGLVRTERMFFEGERILHMREMILAENQEGRARALAQLLPYQKDDFIKLLTAFSGMPIIIRLLDPPLHEFLPRETAAVESVANDLKVPVDRVLAKVADLSEMNPMLGFRGVRVGVIYPEIPAMQCRAIFEAALEVAAKGLVPLPKIEIPLAGHIRELELMREVVFASAKLAGVGDKVKWQFGAMIETPRACVTADELARVCDFFSFGTNDLTQTTCGFSRDDAGKFLPMYLEKKVYAADPFQSIDVEGVGEMIAIAVRKARSTKPGIEIGICGEVGGDPASIEFFHKVGLDNVSCSAYRVPVARLASAQASIKAAKASKKQ